MLSSFKYSLQEGTKAQACLDVGGCTDVPEADFLLPVWVLQAHSRSSAPFLILTLQHSIDLTASYPGLLPQCAGGGLFGHQVLLVEQILDMAMPPPPGIRQSLQQTQHQIERAVEGMQKITAKADSPCKRLRVLLVEEVLDVAMPPLPGIRQPLQSQTVPAPDTAST